MKIIFLNVWHNQLGPELESFVSEQIRDTHIFCFQEADQSFAPLMPTHQALRASKPLEEGINFFQETILYPDMRALSSQVLFEDQENFGITLYTEVEFHGKKIHLLNVHGYFAPRDKKDCPERLLQSQTFIDFFKEKEGMKIIGGDFNILPDQKSIRMFEENGYRDLIKDFKIPTTRNRLAWDKYPTKLYHSDYIFVSPEAKVKSFTVPNVEVSDHLPLILEIEL